MKPSLRKQLTEYLKWLQSNQLDCFVKVWILYTMQV